MHTVEALELALELARGLGYEIRWEWLDGSGGGICRVRGQKKLFLDLSQTRTEQLEVALTGLAEDPRVARRQVPIPDALGNLLTRRAA